MDREEIAHGEPPISAELFARLRRLDGRYSISASRRLPWPECANIHKPLIWLTELFAGPESCGLGWQSEHPDIACSFELTLDKMEADPRNATLGHALPPPGSRPVPGPPIDAELWRRALALSERCWLSLYRCDYRNWGERVTATTLPMWKVALLPRVGKMGRSHHIERPTLSEALRVAADTVPVGKWDTEDRGSSAPDTGPIARGP